MLKKFAFTLYPVIDIDRARNFYENILGLNVRKISANGAWVEYDLPEGGCFVLTTLVENTNPSANAGGSIAFEVDNLDKLVAQLKAKAVKFKRNIFASPVCRMVVILDPESNAITLHQTNKYKTKNNFDDVYIGAGELDGKGVYAKRDFEKGEVVIQYHLEPLTEEQYYLLPESEKMFTHCHWGTIYLYSDPERYVYHSNHGNTYQDLVNKCDIALPDIKKDEMITGNATKDDIDL